jgi:acyl-CoA synthetase (AMP-forming)/AMP-acid ligase II
VAAPGEAGNFLVGHREELRMWTATVHSLLDEAAAEASASSAVRDAHGCWSYGDVVDYSHAVAAWLHARGIRAGQRVVVQWPTNRQLVAMFFGVCRAGAVFVPLNPAMKDFHLRSVLAGAEPALFLPAEQAEPVWREIADLHAAGARAPEIQVDQDDLAVLIYTSGSTATPKGVMGPHRQVTFASRAIQQVLGYRRDDVVFCRFPMSWDYGLYKVLLCVLGRSEIVLADAESDLTLLARIRDVGATIVPIVPSLAAMLLTLAQRDPATGRPGPVRMFTNTGAALPPATIVRLREAFPGAQVVRQFGQTECKRVSIIPPGVDDLPPDIVGRPLPGTTVLILDADGTQLPAGGIGEIVVTGPHVMPGYWREPELTAKTFRPDPDGSGLRLHTGDYGCLDDDGWLHFHGRRDDMFKRKGIRMSTLEIEAAAMDIDGVHAAAAIPPFEGHDLAICVESTLAPHAVLRALAQRLEPAKVPAACHVVDRLPLTGHGKNATRELLDVLGIAP